MPPTLSCARKVGKRLPPERREDVDQFSTNARPPLSSPAPERSRTVPAASAPFLSISTRTASRAPISTTSAPSRSGAGRSSSTTCSSRRMPDGRGEQRVLQDHVGVRLQPRPDRPGMPRPAQASVDESWRYTTERNAFERPIAQFQGVSFPLAEAETQLTMMRQLCYTRFRCATAGCRTPRKPRCANGMCRRWLARSSISAC